MDTNNNGTRTSAATVRRISIYYRTVNLLERHNIKKTTSMELAEIQGISAAMVRKDLSIFGSFGRRGVGYEIRHLKRELAGILGLDRKWGLVLIGAGQYSEVLMNSQALIDNNLHIRKIFEKDPEILRNIPGSIELIPMDQLETRLDPHEDSIAIIALPPPEVQSMINRLGRIGIKAALYLASRSVKAPEDMVVVNQDISIELGMLTYLVNEKIRGR